MTHAFRFFNVTYGILLTSFLTRAAGDNRHKMVLPRPHHKVVRSVGQDCDTKTKCMLWTCCVRTLRATSCYHKTRVGERCSSYNISGIYQLYCPCAPGHGRCFMGRCVLQNTDRHHLRNRL
uniref:Putative secreted peptide n=1 Tax=Rhipicephalus pulchellus TaxID=72859 RepID=L7MA98_RHIPC